MPIAIELVSVYADTEMITTAMFEVAFDEALCLYILPTKALEPILRPLGLRDPHPAVESVSLAMSRTLTRFWRQGHGSGGLPY